MCIELNQDRITKDFVISNNLVSSFKPINIAFYHDKPGDLQPYFNLMSTQTLVQAEYVIQFSEYLYRLIDIQAFIAKVHNRNPAPFSDKTSFRASPFSGAARKKFSSETVSWLKIKKKRFPLQIGIPLSCNIWQCFKQKFCAVIKIQPQNPTSKDPNY